MVEAKKAGHRSSFKGITERKHSPEMRAIASTIRDRTGLSINTLESLRALLTPHHWNYKDEYQSLISVRIGGRDRLFTRNTSYHHLATSYGIGKAFTNKSKIDGSLSVKLHQHKLRSES